MTTLSSARDPSSPDSAEKGNAYFYPNGWESPTDALECFYSGEKECDYENAVKVFFLLPHLFFKSKKEERGESKKRKVEEKRRRKLRGRENDKHTSKGGGL